MARQSRLFVEEENKMKIGVIGSGAWGLALSTVLVDNGHKVKVYARNPLELNSINKNHTQNKAFEDIKLSEKIIAVSSIKETIFDAEAILFAVPSAYAYDVICEVNEILDHKVYVFNATKGLDLTHNSTMQKLIRDNLNPQNVLGISSILGPGFAKEVILKNITAVCAASYDLNYAKFTQQVFSNSYFRVYAMSDVIGAEIGTSLKNAMAIGSGVLRGLGYGENSKSALVTRGLAEITRFGVAFGAKPETFLGLTGVGDLILTCNSKESRNFRAGYQIGQDDTAEIFLKNNKMTVEGIGAIRAVYEIAKENKIDMPIIEALYDVVYLVAKPSDVVDKLMNRPLRREK